MSNYHMRRTDREITDREEMLSLLRGGKYITLALCRENEPYIVTLSYGYDASRHALYFHCAREGQKLEMIARNPAACGTVIEDRGYIEGECAHAYRSLVLRGELHRIEELAEKKHAMEVLMAHLEPDPEVVRQRSLPDDGAYERLGILRLDIQHMTAKQGR